MQYMFQNFVKSNKICVTMKIVRICFLSCTFRLFIKLCSFEYILTKHWVKSFKKNRFLYYTFKIKKKNFDIQCIDAVCILWVYSKDLDSNILWVARAWCGHIRSGHCSSWEVEDHPDPLQNPGIYSLDMEDVEAVVTYQHSSGEQCGLGVSGGAGRRGGGGGACWGGVQGPLTSQGPQGYFYIRSNKIKTGADICLKAEKPLTKLSLERI